MQQRKPQQRKQSEHIEPDNRDESDSSSGSKHKEKDQHNTEGMDFHDTFLNTAPREKYGSMGMGGWSLSSGGFPSDAAKFFSGYAFPSIGTGCDDDIPTMDTGFFSHEQGRPTSLKRDDQATGAPYTMLKSKRDSRTTASADGKIPEPHMNDVLCGRGGSINAHPGNRIFRGWVADRRESYNLAESKADKSRITAEILEKVRDQGPPGRFLQKLVEGKNKQNDPYGVNGYWFEIDDVKALAKISQALREGAPAFRAMHGKKGRKKQHGKASPRTSMRRKQPKKEARGHSPNEKRKQPPTMEVSSSDIPQAVASMPPSSTDGHELDVLFPTTNNIFSVAAPKKSNGKLLDSYPIVHMNDYAASMDEVAGAIPPTPPKKPRPNTTTEAKLPGKCLTPNLLPAPNTPLVSPGFSPFGTAKAAWDAIGFLPNLSPTPGNHSAIYKQPSLQRVHSLSFSDVDTHSIGSFNNPFENDNGNHNLEQLPEPESEEHLNEVRGYPPPLPSPQHTGLSFGRIGGVPGGNNLRNHSSRHKSTNRRESSLSSKSWGSISNLHNHKRKSIA